MPGTVSGTTGIKNEKMGLSFYGVYTWQYLWLNSAFLGIFKSGTGKLGLFKHIWWKEPCFCSTHEHEEDGHKKKIKVHFFTVLHQTQGVAKENRVGGRWFSHPLKLPPVQNSCADGPIASCHNFQSSRQRHMAGSTVNTTAVIFILPVCKILFLGNAPRNFLHKNGGPSGKLVNWNSIYKYFY